MEARERVLSALDAWTANAPSVLSCCTKLSEPQGLVARWLAARRSAGAEVLHFRVNEDSRIERDALAQLTSTLAARYEQEEQALVAAGDEEPSEPWIADGVASVVERICFLIWSRATETDEPRAPSQVPILILDGVDDIVDASGKVWGQILDRAANSEGMHVLANRAQVLLRVANAIRASFGKTAVTCSSLETDQPDDSTAPEWKVDHVALTQVEIISQSPGPDAAIPELSRHTLRYAGAHAECAHWSLSQRRVFLTQAWFAAWQTQPDWPLGFGADVQRFRKLAEREVCSLERQDAIVDLFEAAVVEAVATSHANGAWVLSSPDLERARARALAAVARVSSGVARTSICSLIDAELAKIYPREEVTDQREALLVSPWIKQAAPLPTLEGSELPIQGEPLEQWLAELRAASSQERVQGVLEAIRNTDPSTRWQMGTRFPRIIAQFEVLIEPLVEGLDGIEGIEVRTALALHAKSEMAGRLAKESAALQLRGGDDDTAVQLGFVAHHLNATTAAAVLVDSLGHKSLSSFTHRRLSWIAPFLARICGDDVRLAIAEMFVRRMQPMMEVIAPRPSASPAES